MVTQTSSSSTTTAAAIVENVSDATTLSGRNASNFVSVTAKLAASDPTLKLIPKENTDTSKVKSVNSINATVLIATPIIALYGIMTATYVPKTIWLSAFYTFFSAFGITAGYHRLWSHRAYEASWPYRLMMALAGASAFEGSIKWWSKNHRAHHRFTDTDDDPYSAHRGLLWSHIGWMLFYKEGKACRKVDLSDLMADPIVVWQHKNYIPVALFMAFVFPTLVAGLGWGDWTGGYFFAAVARLVLVHHATFCVNSLAHYLGDQPFDDYRTPRDHFFTALVTMGEGYHNFHHEFPSDYRNAIKFYQYDPTKWLIKLCSFVGLTYDLRTFPKNEISKGVLQTQARKIEEEKSKLDWGQPLAKLPRWSQEEFKLNQKSKPAMLVIKDIVYDVTDFIGQHPGGEGFLKVNFGRDVTQHFNGGVYKHSNAARNLMSHFRIAVISDSEGGEIFGQFSKKNKEE